MLLQNSRNLHVFSVQLPTLKPSHLTRLDPRSCANSPCWNVAPPGNRGFFGKSESFTVGVGVVMDGSYIEVYPFRFIHPFIHSFIHSFIHLFIHSFIHSFIRSFVHSFIRSFVHSFIHPFIHSCHQSIPAINPSHPIPCHAINPSGSESIHIESQEFLPSRIRFTLNTG